MYLKSETHIGSTNDWPISIVRSLVIVLLPIFSPDSDSETIFKIG